MDLRRKWQIVGLTIGTFILSGIVLFSCQQQTDQIGGLRYVCFDTEILPLLKASCAATDCHDASAAAGYRLDSYEGILKGISAGNAHKSRLYRSVISTTDERMPPDTVLSREERMLIRVWIEQGATNYLCSEPVTDTLPEEWSDPNVCFERDILPTIMSSCGITGCHDPYTFREEFNFTNYEGILRGIVAGNPGLSKIYKVITEDEPEDRMPPPPYEALLQKQIDSIYRWIMLGAPDNYCGNYCDTFNVKYTSHLASILENKCKTCHSSAFANGGVVLETYDGLVSAVSSGAFPSVLTGANGYVLMPPSPSSPLSECDIRKFEIWIRDQMPL